MAMLFKVMMRCPSTSEVFDTGIHTTGREALNNNAYRQGMMSCRICGKFHSLDEDAFMEVEKKTNADTLWRPNP
jgi:hypothetical protein